ncbi:MAG: hypothetical protein HZB44_01730 [Actinobacteria bacterium]|nr:hypothetical protein [Actinomycetota bacterium]
MGKASKKKKKIIKKPAEVRKGPGNAGEHEHSSTQGDESPKDSIDYPLAQATLLILIFTIIVYLISFLSLPVLADSRWSIPTAVSIYKEGDVDLNEYRAVVKANDYYKVRTIGSRLYNEFPIGVSLLVLPIVYFYDQFTDLGESVNYATPKEAEMFMASCIVALTAILLYLIARKKGLGFAGGLFLALIFTFGTSAWSTASLSLWQHGPSMLMITITLYLVLIAKERPFIIQFAALPLAFSYIIRPTNSIAIILFSIYIFLEYRRYFLRYILWGILMAIPFLWFNYSIYGSLSSPYYATDRLFGRSLETILVALAGNLISPGRGILIFSPILILSFAGVIIKIRRSTFERLDLFLILIIGFHWLTISMVTEWWGGHSYGPRFFTDMMPLMIYFMIPVFLIVPKLDGWHKKAVIAGISVLTIFSVFVHFRGSTCGQVQDWNVHPDIMENQSRLWDWEDIPYLTGIDGNLFRWQEDCYDPELK